MTGTSSLYTIEGISDDEARFEVGRPQGGTCEYTIKINGAERRIRILGITPDGMEFLLDDTYHRVRYESRTTREISMMVDGAPVSVGMHADLDKIVYKNSGGGGGGSGPQIELKSQIPGKVVSVSVSDGDTVAKGDVVCTLESMKMQVAVKAHKDGVIKSIKARESVTFAKGDVIAQIE